MRRWLIPFVALMSFSVNSVGFAAQFESARLLPDASIQLNLAVEPEKDYVVQASLDLVNWSQLFSFRADKATLAHTDIRAITFTERFYRLLEFDPPANDHFEAPFQVVGSEAMVVGHNFSGTEQPGEPMHSHFDDGNRSVWWSWVAPADGEVRLSAVGTLFNSMVAVYEGSALANLDTVAKRRFYGKLLQFDATAGKTYRIAVDGNFGASGIIELKLRRTDFTTGAAPSALNHLRVNLSETSDPNTPPRVIQFSADGTTWVEFENGKTNAIEVGAVASYSPSGATATLKLEGIRGDEILPYDYVLEFRSATEGIYRYTLYGEPRGSGRFFDFRDGTTDLAPATLAGRTMVSTRESTSAGTGGQTHFYAFDLDGRFHDSDGAEHATGTYDYLREGSTATLVLDYTGSADFVGDRATVQMTFTSTTDGTYVSRYKRNDGAEILIEGKFVIDQ